MSQRLSERTDCDIRIFDWGDTYRASEVRSMKRLMRYGRPEYEKDWELAISLAVIMSLPETKADFGPMLDRCFMRIHAYIANHPDDLPFEYRIGCSTIEELVMALKGIRGGKQ
jgi:hypothetical protein